MLAVALPVAAYAACLYLLYAQITRTLDPFHVLLIAGTAALVVLPVVLAAAGVDMVWCLAVLALAPWVTVVGLRDRRSPAQRRGAGGHRGETPSVRSPAYRARHG